MNGYMIAGVITGLIVAFILVMVGMNFTKKNRKEKHTYDERQVAARGVGYKYAFITLIVYNVIYGLVDMMLPEPWAEDLTGLMIGVCLAAVVHIVYSIRHDCYISMNEDPKKYKIFIAVLAIINGVAAVFQGLNGELIEDGMLTNNCANLIVALVLAAVLVAMGTKKCDDEEED